MPKNKRRSDDIIEEELAFYDRPDLTPYLVHLTKKTLKGDKHTAFENLVQILKSGEIRGSGKTGFVKGPNKATCFMDVPFLALKYILNEQNTKPDAPRYEPYGVYVTKSTAYRGGCRPVLYLADSETKALGIGKQEVWRVVRFERSKTKVVNWLHEREWRCKGSFDLPLSSTGVLVKDLSEARKLQKLIKKNEKDFKIKPNCIIPLTVLCQGLPRLHK